MKSKRIFNWNFVKWRMRPQMVFTRLDYHRNRVKEIPKDQRMRKTLAVLRKETLELQKHAVFMDAHIKDLEQAFYGGDTNNHKKN